ncbi:DUF2789 family protein [Neisseria sp. 19428wB4_WF04]|nr:DUF2789 family protein [Neisseria sp. 19428wB4_WF04]TFU40240.1 DUF2789 family protein [Neisseria sp. WF04]TFV01802.1 DUF2789 family protein [Bacillus stratosphericus]
MEQCAGFTDLFLQLGLPAEPQEIAGFIMRHRPLPESVSLSDAPFWNTAQAQFLQEQRQLDEPPFNILIDQLSEALRG